MQKTFQKFMVPIASADSSGEGGAQLSDGELYQLCCEYGAMALHARRKFLGLLPEVARRRLYEAHGFSSIFVFAAKLAGVSEEQVRLALSLEIKFRDKPALHIKLTNGEISINKLARVASVATSENANFWSDQAERLSHRALDTLVRDERTLESLRVHSNPSQLSQKSMFGQGPTEAEVQLQLSPENLKRLLELQNKGIDFNFLIAAALDQRENEIKKEKEAIVREQEEKLVMVGERESGSPSRHVPVRLVRLVKKEFGTKCAIGHCKKLAETIHHTARFALSGNHNPNYLAPLCRDHHQIAHSIDGKYQQKKLPG